MCIYLLTCTLLSLLHSMWLSFKRPWLSDGFVPLELTPEQRLLQRTVPFFPLPGYETVPNTANIKARVDTHNPR